MSLCDNRRLRGSWLSFGAVVFVSQSNFTKDANAGFVKTYFFWWGLLLRSRTAPWNLCWRVLRTTARIRFLVSSEVPLWGSRAVFAVWFSKHRAPLTVHPSRRRSAAYWQKLRYWTPTRLLNEFPLSIYKQLITATPRIVFHVNCCKVQKWFVNYRIVHFVHI